MTKRKCISTRILTRLLAVFLSFSPFMTLQAAAQQSPVPLSLGLGGASSLRYHIAPAWSLQLKNSVLWKLK